MRSKIKNGTLVIELPLEKPRPSATGKTLLVASTRGVKRSAALYKGQNISVVANAFIFPNGQFSEAKAKTSKANTDDDQREDDDDD
jgi:hypothetical protein